MFSVFNLVCKQKILLKEIRKPKIFCGFYLYRSQMTKAVIWKKKTFKVFVVFIKLHFSRPFTLSDEQASIRLNCVVGSESLNDVTIQLYHARQLFGGRMNSTRMNKIEMFSVNFNTCFVPPGAKSIRFNRLAFWVLSLFNFMFKNIEKRIK